MLKDPRQKTMGCDAHRLAIEIKGLDLDFGVARNLAVDVGYAQATLQLLNWLTLEFNNLGVDKYIETFILAIVKIMADHYHPVGLANLDGGQGCGDLVLARGLPVECSADHIPGQVRNRLVDQTHPLRAGAQLGMWDSNNRCFGHSKLIGSRSMVQSAGISLAAWINRLRLLAFTTTCQCDLPAACSRNAGAGPKTSNPASRCNCPATVWAAVWA